MRGLLLVGLLFATLFLSGCGMKLQSACVGNCDKGSSQPYSWVDSAGEQYRTKPSYTCTRRGRNVDCYGSDGSYNSCWQRGRYLECN